MNDIKKSESSTSAGTRTSSGSSVVYTHAADAAVLLVPYAPRGALVTDCFEVTVPFNVGRASTNSLSVEDRELSKKHFRIIRRDDVFFIEDLKSKNGTFVDGYPVSKKQPLPSGSVIRAGRSVFVFHADAGALLELPPVKRYGMAGRFHTGPFIEELQRGRFV